VVEGFPIAEHHGDITAGSFLLNDPFLEVMDILKLTKQ
jgi:hypothetical protein